MIPASKQLKAAGKLARVENEIRRLEQQLDQLDLWLPSADLRHQAEKALELLGKIRQRINRQLVVTLVGPSGAGKSTIFNALAGRDEISSTGPNRPTTRGLQVLCSDGVNAANILGIEDSTDVDIHIFSQPAFPEQIILVDTPDTDSVAAPIHRILVKQAIAISDVLICVFDTENPKRRDHADFLAPLISLFAGHNLVVVLNKCDRQDREELHQNIIPDFRKYLAVAWQMPVDQVLAVSARSHLQNPDWDPQIKPRHNWDQFDKLGELIHGELARPEAVINIRLENARHLHSYLMEALRNQVAKDLPWLQKALESVAKLETTALEHSLQALETDSETLTQGTGIRLYQLLARGWMGPVGWILALWSRLLIFGAGAISILRPGRPLSQAAGLVSALRHRSASKAKLSRLSDAGAATAAAQAFQMTVLQNWPHTADLLCKAHFDHKVRDPQSTMSAAIELADTISETWAVALDKKLQKAAGRLQNGLLQLILNLPALAALVYAGWLTLKNFFRGSYLPADFFIHFLAAEIILVLAGFFIVQLAVQFTVRKGRLQRQAFSQLQGLSRSGRAFEKLPAIKQASLILSLASVENDIEHPGLKDSTG